MQTQFQSLKISNAIVDKIIYYNPENSFAVLKVLHSDSSFILKGVCPDLKVFSSVEKAQKCKCYFEGIIERHPKYGVQVKADNISIEIPGLFFFLTNVVTGIGPVLAKELIEHYTETGLTNILDNNPQELLNFKGIKEKRLQNIMSSWEEFRQIKKLADFFYGNEIQISSSMLLKIYNYFSEDKTEDKKSNDDIISIIKSNPYILARIRGIGFKTADKIALKLGIDPYSIKRMNALLTYILQTEAEINGHTYLTIQELIELAKNNIAEEVDENKFQEVFNTTIQKNRKFIILQDKIALKKYYDMEFYIYENFKERLKTFTPYIMDDLQFFLFIERKERELNIKLNPQQINAIKTVAEGRSVFILCGYAGTGKSTISKIILDYLSRFIPKDEIKVCAFTGMASKRIKDLTGYSGGTIHSLLGYSPTTRTFTHNKENPISVRAILVDESSMLNLELFYSFLQAIPQNAVIILVGDNAQLPPIGEGNIFSDFLSKDWIPKVKLDQIYRQSDNSVITYFASFIRQGKFPYGINKKYKDFEFIKKDIQNYWVLKRNKEDEIIDKEREKLYHEIQQELLLKIAETCEEFNLQGIEKIQNIQVISPMKDTVIGTNNLNLILQEKINTVAQEEYKIRNYKLKPFDKVIHLENKNMPCIDRESYEKIYNKEKSLSDVFYKCKNSRIFNGNLGMVLDINPNEELFSVSYPEVGIVIYKFSEFKDIIDLGYTLTIHKVQGNQFPFVFIPMANRFYIMLNTKLLYTAITRAQQKVVIIGQPYALKHACTNIESTIRKTFLSFEKIPIGESSSIF